MKKITGLLLLLWSTLMVTAQATKPVKPPTKKTATPVSNNQKPKNMASEKKVAPYLYLNNDAIQLLITNSLKTIDAFKGNENPTGYKGNVFLFRPSAGGNGTANIFDFSRVGSMCYNSESPVSDAATLQLQRQELIRLKETVSPNSLVSLKNVDGDDSYTFYYWETSGYVKIVHTIETKNNTSNFNIYHFSNTSNGSGRVLIDSSFDKVIESAADHFKPFVGEKEKYGNYFASTESILRSGTKNSDPVITLFYDDKPIKALFLSTYYADSKEDVYKLLDEVKMHIQKRYPKTIVTHENGTEQSYYIFENFFPDDAEKNNLFKIEMGYWTEKQQIIELEMRQK